MIIIEMEEFTTILEAFANEVSDDSGDILREDPLVIGCLQTVETIAKRTDGLLENLSQNASLFCLTFEDVFLHPLGVEPSNFAKANESLDFRI